MKIFICILLGIALSALGEKDVKFQDHQQDKIIRDLKLMEDNYVDDADFIPMEKRDETIRDLENAASEPNKPKKLKLNGEHGPQQGKQGLKPKGQKGQPLRDQPDESDPKGHHHHHHHHHGLKGPKKPKGPAPTAVSSSGSSSGLGAGSGNSSKVGSGSGLGAGSGSGNSSKVGSGLGAGAGSGNSSKVGSGSGIGPGSGSGSGKKFKWNMVTQKKCAKNNHFCRSKYRCDLINGDYKCKTDTLCTCSYCAPAKKRYCGFVEACKGEFCNTSLKCECQS